MNPKVNYGLWIMCQCRLIDCDVYTSLVGDVEVGKTASRWGGIQGLCTFCSALL